MSSLALQRFESCYEVCERLARGQPLQVWISRIRRLREPGGHVPERQVGVFHLRFRGWGRGGWGVGVVVAAARRRAEDESRQQTDERHDPHGLRPRSVGASRSVHGRPRESRPATHRVASTTLHAETAGLPRFPVLFHADGAMTGSSQSDTSRPPLGDRWTESTNMSSPARTWDSTKALRSTMSVAGRVSAISRNIRLRQSTRSPDVPSMTAMYGAVVITTGVPSGVRRSRSWRTDSSTYA